MCVIARRGCLEPGRLVGVGTTALRELTEGTTPKYRPGDSLVTTLITHYLADGGMSLVGLAAGQQVHVLAVAGAEGGPGPDPQVAPVYQVRDSGGREWLVAEPLLALLPAENWDRTSAQVAAESLTPDLTVRVLRSWPRRAALEQLLRQEACAPCSMLVGDIGALAGFNYRYGHEWGDRLLVGTWQVLRAGLLRCFPDGDAALFHFGGDLFVAVLPPLDEQAWQTLHTALHTTYPTMDATMRVAAGATAPPWWQTSGSPAAVTTLCCGIAHGPLGFELMLRAEEDCERRRGRRESSRGGSGAAGDSVQWEQ